jgi:signal transduction histidine kinase
VLVLHIVQGPQRGRKFELPAHEPQMIGRSSESLPIVDVTVSRRHAELTPDDGRWYLRDLHSANGTFVNGRRIDARVQLSPGDQIRCGSTIMVFAVTPDQAAADADPAIAMLDADAFEVTVESKARPGHDALTLAGQADEASEHLRLIYELTALTSSIIDRDELLNKVMDLVFNEFHPDRGFILLQDSPAARPQPAVVRYRQRPRTLDEGRIPVSRTIVHHTLEKGEGVLSTNAMNDQRFRSGDSVQDYGIRSAMCVPIRTAERVFGVIHVDSSLADFTFTPQQLRLMNAVGLHTGLALQSAEALSQMMKTERLAAMGETVASLSHSVKNILQGLRGGADAVELALSKQDMRLAQEGWPILARNLDRIYALTLNMLAWAKPRALEIDLVSLDNLIREVIDLIQPQTERKKAALGVQFAPDVPPVPVDAAALHQALMNVMTNAVEAIPTRGGAIEVRTSFDAARHEARITIADNGPGVPAEARESIFDPFVTTKGQRGTGLGLAVTRKIVQQHGGRIELAAPASGASGAIFTIVLPSDRTSAMDLGDTRLPRPAPAADRDEADMFE